MYPSLCYRRRRNVSTWGEPVAQRVQARTIALVLLTLAGMALAGVAHAASPPRTAAEFEAYKKAQDQASNVAYQAGDFDRCRAIETEMLALSRQFGDRREEASSVYGLGLVDTTTGRPDQAEARFRESIVLWKAMDDQRGLASSLRGLGRVLEARGRLAEAAEVQVAALELFLKFGKPMDQSESYYSLARLFMNLENYPASRRAVDRAIELMGPTPPDFPLGLNLCVRADVLRELGEFAAARVSAQQGLDAFTRTKSAMGIAIGQLALGKALAATGEADAGLALLRAGETAALGMKEEVLASDLQFAQGMVLVAEKRFEESLVPLARALEIGERLKLDQVVRNASLEQEKAFSGLGRLGEALAASKRALATHRKMADLSKMGDLAGRSAESELSAVSSRFLSLDEATRESEAVLAPETPAPVPASKASPWLWGLAALALLGLGALAWRLRRARDRLASEHAQLQDHSAQLAQQVSIDPLTGALTRRAFTEDLATMLQLGKATRAPVSLAVFDLDHFKQVNDQHGHLTGDGALRLLVGLVREQLDSEDLFGRFGGDEFLLASRSDAATLARLAERIRESVQLRSAAPDSGLPPLSISLGVAQAGRDTGYDAEDLFDRADTALYAAKAGGRNRVVVAEADAPPRGNSKRLRQPANGD